MHHLEAEVIDRRLQKQHEPKGMTMTITLLRPDWYFEKKAFHMICAVYDTPASSGEGSV